MNNSKSKMNEAQTIARELFADPSNEDVQLLLLLCDLLHASPKEALSMHDKSFFVNAISGAKEIIDITYNKYTYPQDFYPVILAGQFIRNANFKYLNPSDSWWRKALNLIKH